jgi:hypothetical protein
LWRTGIDPHDVQDVQTGLPQPQAAAGAEQVTGSAQPQAAFVEHEGPQLMQFWQQFPPPQLAPPQRRTKSGTYGLQRFKS